ncbi:hypothetical protein GCM10011452_38220 [Gemmobacter lanyuensis]|uniref:Trimeric autotransporter adhesin YadA-like C-terminal membrane anchor domain-containing protein n=1 Tax=Gemmobacter lanyuensis TaxID=1054497 RepID=A0A918J4R5_9RHOB|nr:YadA C-terminal domain-containing protein [Gemmobacter lanyuensis]GGW46911.1 hypothetical protein GCM10011452_38220 [Gemmobacter lanyuensis]
MQTNLKSQIAARMGADRKFYQVTKIVATATAIFIPSSVKSQDLIVNGDGVFTGALASTEIQTSDLLVLGGATVAGPVSVAGVADMNSLTVNEEAIIAGALSVDGPTRMQTLNVTGSSQLANTNVTGDAAISGAVSVSGESSLSNATVQGNLSVQGPANFEAPAAFSDRVSVGSSITSAQSSTGTLNVRNAATINTLSVTGNTQLEDTNIVGNLAVSGTAAVDALEVESATVENLEVSGTLTAEHMVLPSSFTFGDITVENQATLGRTDISGPLHVTSGTSQITLTRDGTSIASGINGGQFSVGSDAVSLQHNGQGLTVAGGTTIVSGATTSTVSAAGNTLSVTRSGVSLSNSTGQPVRLSGVADGIARNDAVNVGQFNRGLQSVSDGVAMSMAMSQIPAPIPGTNYSFGMAIGTFDGSNAFAFGGTALFGDATTVRGALSKGGSEIGAGVGVGWSF